MARRDWYRKLEIREQGAFAMLPAYVRGLYSMLLKFADDDGRILLGGLEPAVAVARICRAHPGELRLIRRDLPQLLAVGRIRLDADALVVPEVADGSARQDRDTWDKSEYPAVVERDRGRCRYCGTSDRPTIDHVIPRCQGGGDSRGNLVVACRSCNNRKGGRTPEQAGMRLLPAPGVN